MKYVITLFFLLFGVGLHAQLSATDSTNIGFKAKLLTVSRFGITSKENIMKDIESQSIVFLKTGFKNFLFCKVTFSQPYRLSNGNSIGLQNKCPYYLAYNIASSEFYRLGGFETLDIKQFFENLLIGEPNLDKVSDPSPVEEIDMTCLLRYMTLSEKQRLKKDFSCSCTCDYEYLFVSKQH